MINFPIWLIKREYYRFILQTKLMAIGYLGKGLCKEQKKLFSKTQKIMVISFLELYRIQILETDLKYGIYRNVEIK